MENPAGQPTLKEAVGLGVPEGHPQDAVRHLVPFQAINGDAETLKRMQASAWHAPLPIRDGPAITTPNCIFCS